MKNLYTLFFAAILFFTAQAQITDSWQQINALGSDRLQYAKPQGRHSAAGFAIGNKGYIGPGLGNGIGQVSSTYFVNDFWEFDTQADRWNVKSTWGGFAKEGAVGFSIGTKGYIGTGRKYVTTNKYNYYKDFWEYDSGTDTWTQKADFAGGVRSNSVGFSIGNKGYVGGGDTIYPSNGSPDFWEYNPTNNQWTQKSNFGGGNVNDGVGVGASSKGYVLSSPGTTGIAANTWEYNPANNQWTQKASLPKSFYLGLSPSNFPYPASAAGFSINGIIYIGTGGGPYYSSSVGLNNRVFVAYDPQTDTWTKKGNVPFYMVESIGFAINGKGYFTTGFDGSVATYSSKSNGAGQNEIWEYDPANDSWAKKANYETHSTAAAFSFVIGNKGYVGNGYYYNTASGVGVYNNDSLYKHDFWEFDQTTGGWTQKADYPGVGMEGGVGFSIGNKGYAGTGVDLQNNEAFTNDFWEYDPTNNQWTQKASLGSVGRAYGVGFSVNNKGYIGTGLSNNNQGTFLDDFWEYAPNSNQWVQVSNFGGSARISASSFVVNGKAYVGLGSPILAQSTTYYNDLYEYNPSLDAWNQKANLPSNGRKGAVGFSIGTNGYFGTGMYSTGTLSAYTETYKKDLWEYNTLSDTWTQRASYAGDGRQKAVGFAIGNRAYIGTGVNSFIDYVKKYALSDFWEYTPANVSTGIAKEPEIDCIKLYPNPNSGLFTVEFSDAQEHSIKITHVLGRVVLDKLLVEKQRLIDLKELSNGTYFLNVTKGSLQKQIRFQIIK